jgi:DNA-binding response OmpR family regulator
MMDSPYRILLVEPDPDTLETLVSALVGRFETNLTCVASGEECIRIERSDAHDLVITEHELPDMDACELARELGAIRRRPLIVLGERPTAKEAIELLRLGAADVVCKPFRVSEMLESVDRALGRLEMRRRHMHRFRCMQRSLRKVTRQRAELNDRVELVCKDLVHAHRRLVHRVLDFQAARGQGDDAPDDQTA